MRGAVIRNNSHTHMIVRVAMVSVAMVSVAMLEEERGLCPGWDCL